MPTVHVCRLYGVFQLILFPRKGTSGACPVSHEGGSTSLEPQVTLHLGSSLGVTGQISTVQ
jgi:hypothetical protein